MEQSNSEFKSMIEGEIVNSDLLARVKAAGITALRIRNQGLIAEVKTSKVDIVTQGDLAITKDLKSSLIEFFGSDIDFLDEETDATHAIDLKTNRLIAVIDPIDGTGNYYNSYTDLQKGELEREEGTGNWGISIGFVKNGEVVGGTIYQPELDKMFYAERGKGAYMNDQRLAVSETSTLKGSQPYFDYPYPKDRKEYDQTGRLLAALVSSLHTKKPVKLGSQVIEIIKVAEGVADFFFHLKTKPWDIAAALSIIPEAGGDFTDGIGTAYQLFGDNIVFKNNNIDLKKFYETVRSA